MIILDGYKLSFKAFPSLKNSGEKIILLLENFCCKKHVCPTGIVDLITTYAFLLCSRASLTALSTDEVSKLLEIGS